MIKLSFNLGLLALAVSFYQQEPPPTDFMMAGAVFSLAVYLAINKIRPKFYWPELFAVGFLVFNFFQLVSNRTSKSLFWVGVTTFLILAFLSLKILSEKYGLDKLFKAYIIAALVNLFLMFVAFISLYSFHHNFDLMTQFGRAQGLFKDPNVAGPFLIPSLIYFLNDSVERPRLWKFVVSAALTAGVFLSFSRGALIALGVAVLLWLLVRRKDLLPNKRLYLLVIIFQVTALAILFSYGPFNVLAQQRFRLTQSYDTQSRAVSWQTGLQGFTDNPGGSGPGTFESGVIASEKANVIKKINNLQITDEQKRQMINDLDTAKATTVTAQVGVTITPSAHNTYLRVLRENGVIGIVLFLAFVLSTIWFGRDILLNGPRFDGFQVAIFVSWIGFLANSMVIDTLHWRLIWYLPALLLASLGLKRAKS